MADSAVAATESYLVRVLGTWALGASIVNVTVGGGIFRLPAAAAQLLGPSALWAYVVCALAMGLVVLCFADAGSRVALTGGPYAYVETAFGPFVGFLSGVLLWVAGRFGLAAVDRPGGLGRDAGPRHGRPDREGGVLVGAYALLAGINVGGVKQGARLNVIATAAKLPPARAGSRRDGPAEVRNATDRQPVADHTDAPVSERSRTTWKTGMMPAGTRILIFVQRVCIGSVRSHSTQALPSKRPPTQRDHRPNT